MFFLCLHLFKFLEFCEIVVSYQIKQTKNPTTLYRHRTVHELSTALLSECCHRSAAMIMILYDLDCMYMLIKCVFWRDSQKGNTILSFNSVLMNALFISIHLVADMLYKQCRQKKPVSGYQTPFPLSGTWYQC